MVIRAFQSSLGEAVLDYGPSQRSSRVAQSADSRWRRLYEAALVEVDQELLPRRVRVAKMAIHSRIIKLHKVDDAGGVWALMDALHVLDDLLKMNETDLPRRA
jgi:hypothetical protein